jgi:hypothetical protein
MRSFGTSPVADVVSSVGGTRSGIFVMVALILSGVGIS